MGNDISCPDIMLLPKIANLLHNMRRTSVKRTEKEMVLPPEERRKNPDDMVLRINVNSSHGDKVRVNLPIPLIKVAIEMA